MYSFIQHVECTENIQRNKWSLIFEDLTVLRNLYVYKPFECYEHEF